MMQEKESITTSSKTKEEETEDLLEIPDFLLRQYSVPVKKGENEIGSARKKYLARKEADESTRHTSDATGDD